jgi:hypothetical protein
VVEVAEVDGSAAEEVMALVVVVDPVTLLVSYP